MTLLPFLNWDELAILWTDIVGRRTNDFVIDSLLNDVRAPTRRPGDYEQWGEHGGRHAHTVVAHGAEPIEIRKHLLRVPHHGFQPLGNRIHFPVAHVLRKSLRYFFNDLVTRIRDCIDGWAEPDRYLFGLSPPANVGLRLGRAVITALNFKSHFVGSSVLRSPQCADGSGNAGENIRSGAGDRPTCKGRGIEFVLRVKNQARVHRTCP